MLFEEASDRDQMHFSPIEKTDMIIYERLTKADKKFMLPLKCAEYDAMLILNLKYAQIERNASMKALESIKQIEKK